MRAAWAAAVGVLGCVLACDFTGSWNTYCSNPGRCSAVDGGVARISGNTVTEVAQGGGLVDITLNGRYLDFPGSEIEITPGEIRRVGDAGWSANQVTFRIDVPHGAPEEAVRFRVIFDPDRMDEAEEASGFLTVTPIVVAGTGTVSAAGTYRDPLCCLTEAARRADAGDTILLRAGRYETEDWSNADFGGGLALQAGVNVRGEGPGVTVLANAPGNGRTAFWLATPGHTISRLSTLGFYRGIVAVEDGGAVLQEVEIEGPGEAGLWVKGQSTVSLQSVVIRDAGTSPGPGTVWVSEDGRLSLRNSQITSNRIPGLYVEGAALVNGGTASEAGGNTFDNQPGPEIVDARPPSSGIGLEFSQTSLRGITPTGVTYTASDTDAGIQINNAGNGVQFY